MIIFINTLKYILRITNKELTMARPGVTYQDVSAAANQVKGQGKNPTIENVRAILGTGSIGTINNHLRKWKETQNAVRSLATSENIPEELASLVKGLWERVINQAEARFTEIEGRYQNDISELTQELDKYKNNNKRWQQLYNQWQQEKSQLVNDKLAIEQALASKQEHISTLSAQQNMLELQAQEKQERIDELHRLHQQSQQNLEHYRESSREQRQIDQQQYEQQKQQYQADIKLLNHQLMTQDKKLLTLQQQYNALQHTYSDLEKSHTQIQSQYQDCMTKLNSVENEKAKYVQASQHWETQYTDSQKTLNQKMNQLIEIQAEAKSMSHHLADMKQNGQQLQDQNKLLAHDKWMLGQEKAQLEGQLKQMQKMIEA